MSVSRPNHRDLLRRFLAVACGCLRLIRRMARAMDRWRKLTQPYQDAAREAIKRVAAKADLSKDVREVVTRALQETST